MRLSYEHRISVSSWCLYEGVVLCRYVLILLKRVRLGPMHCFLASSGDLQLK